MKEKITNYRKNVLPTALATMAIAGCGEAKDSVATNICPVNWGDTAAPVNSAEKTTQRLQEGVDLLKVDSNHTLESTAKIKSVDNAVCIDSGQEYLSPQGEQLKNQLYKAGIAVELPYEQ